MSGPNGPVRLSFAITHMNTRPDRRRMVADMLHKMGGPSVIDREAARWQITRDTGKGLWANHWRSWASGMLATNATHHMVMEDDLILCNDFLAGVKEALSWAPHGPVSLYANRAIMAECRARGSSWAEIVDGCWGQALIMPTDQVVEFIRWDREFLKASAYAYDSRLAIWSMYTNKSVWCTAPSLVEHAGAGSSTLGYSNSRRTARWFIGESASALGIDWSKDAERPPKTQDKHVSWHGYKDIWKSPPEGIYR
jgi:hypothetical protein